jgi:NAD(P)-dependent dehydrogenase (short-subunit alcohol dehydrogenase family)
MKALVTGGTSGIGYGVATQLIAAGWDVTIVGRNAARGAKIASESGARFLQADLSLLSEVSRVAQCITGPIDALVMCAGIFQPEDIRTVEGHELTFATNYLGRFALSQLLLDRINTDGCITMISGNGQHKNVSTDWAAPRSGMEAARTAALAVDLYAAELAAQAPQIRVHTCYPGIVKTDLLRDAPWLMRAFVRLFGTSVQRGSAHITRMNTHRHDGIHWNKGTPMRFSPPLPVAAAKALLDYSRAQIQHLTVAAPKDNAA